MLMFSKPFLTEEQDTGKRPQIPALQISERAFKSGLEIDCFQVWRNFVRARI